MNRPDLDIDALRDSLPPWPGNDDGHAAMNDILKIFGADFRHGRGPVRYRCAVFDSAGYRIASHQWLQQGARGTVLILHGYFDHIPLYRRIIGCLLQQGFSVAGFDLPGHGLSSGQRASIRDFTDYQHILRDFLDRLAASGEHPAPFHVIGQSTGGAIAMHYLLERAQQGEPVRFDKVLLLAPLVRPMGWRLVFIAHLLLSPFLKRIARTFTPNSHDEDFLGLLRMEDPFQSDYLDVTWIGAMKRWVRQFEALPSSGKPLLVIQGTQDFTVDWRYNLKVIARKFPRADILRIDDGRHQLANESTEYLQPILAAMKDYFCGKVE